MADSGSKYLRSSSTTSRMVPSDISTTGSTLDLNLYGYTPSQAAGYIFVIIFIMTTRKSSFHSVSRHVIYNTSAVFHIFQAIRSRAWWLFPTLVIAGAAEVVGWVARTKSSYDPNVRMAYIIQYVCALISPLLSP